MDKIKKKYNKSRSSSFKKKHPNKLSSVTFMPYRQYAEGEKRDKVVENNNSSSEPDKDFFILPTFNSSYTNCSCCNENDGKEKLYECCACLRKYHDNCHIPIIVSGSEKTKQLWQCTMCEDMNAISKNLGEDDDLENISVGKVGRKIAERILMEFYCRVGSSDIFRKLPDEEVCPIYYTRVVRPIALNNVRDHLIRKKNYKLSDIVEEIKQIFVNATLYYKVDDPNFDLARRFITHLLSLYQTWINFPTRDKEWTVYC
ncbi:uncharacterized protein LOC111040544 [Myzus persicae]|uniref:uncharacterized protein LOC111040544 n=1 Tax=Myzus persicae TaxID=13164 RepID=UPI000B93899C|nr:uncharacterized protein LOC111040544 [Myzus persicae]